MNKYFVKSDISSREVSSVHNHKIKVTIQASIIRPLYQWECCGLHFRQSCLRPVTTSGTSPDARFYFKFWLDVGISVRDLKQRAAGAASRTDEEDGD